MELLEGTKIVASRDQVSCRTGQDATIMKIKDGTYYALDPVAARVWDLLQAPCTIGDIRDILIDEYQVDPARLELDIREFLNELASHQLVETK